jgi:DNA repair exonuclease SbcCD ATPase subunit
MKTEYLENLKRLHVSPRQVKIYTDTVEKSKKLIAHSADVSLTKCPMKSSGKTRPDSGECPLCGFQFSKGHKNALENLLCYSIQNQSYRLSQAEQEP